MEDVEPWSHVGLLHEITTDNHKEHEGHEAARGAR
jgi:hypothetical protein